jgi:hypothetical protein
MRSLRARRFWLAAAATVLILGSAGLVGAGGCGSDSTAEDGEGKFTGGVATTVASPPSADGGFGQEGWDEASTVPTTIWAGGTGSGSLTALERRAAQKVITNAQLEIEVESGQFQSVFEQALLLADRYGGYIISSSASASGEEGTMQSGVIALRVPAISFDQALADASRLGTLKNRQIQTQDVTEEYVDLQARITNAEAQVKALRELLVQAKTVDEVLQVQQYLAVAQGDLESLRGRLSYLQEHTSFSTLALTIYESGVTVTPAGEWGIVRAFEDALRNLVDAVNAIIRGLGVLIPVVIVLAIIAAIVYLIWRRFSRRRRREQAMYQQYPQPPQGWSGPQAYQGAPGGYDPQTGAPVAGTVTPPSAAPPAATAAQATRPEAGATGGTGAGTGTDVSRTDGR